MQKIRKMFNHFFSGKVVRNVSWIMFQNIYTMLLGIIFTGIIARHYGTSGYGIINFALSYVSLFSFIAIFGTDHIILKDLTESKYDNGIVLGTNLFLRIILSIIAFVISQIIAIIVYDKNTNIAILLFSINTILCSLDVIAYYAQSKIQNKYISISKIISTTIFCGLKLLAILLNFNILVYISFYLIETLIYGLMLILSYKKIKSENIKWSINKDYLLQLLKKSKFYALSSLMVTVYMKIDQVMIGTIYPNKSDVGIYSAAVRIAEMWIFVPLSIITSYKPIIIKSREDNNSTYYQNFQKLYSIVSFVCFISAIIVSLFSKIGIMILYGEKYIDAYIPLIILVFGTWISVLGNIHYLWMTCENKEKYSIFYSFCGCVSNIILNILLIPRYGIIGAAIATIISQIFANIISFLLIKETRILSLMLIKSLNPINGFKIVLSNFKSKSNE